MEYILNMHESIFNRFQEANNQIDFTCSLGGNLQNYKTKVTTYTQPRI